jgi:PAS domain S-box-containing protein
MSDLINQVPCGIFVLDEAGVIRTTNATAEQQLGYTSIELIGQPIGKVLTLASRLFYQTHVYPLINLQGRATEVALTLSTRTAERIPILFNAVRQRQDEEWLIYCAYLPLGQRHRYEAELIQARKTAEQAQLSVQQSEARYRALAAELEKRVAERTQELSRANSELNYLNADLKRSNENLQQFAYIASHDLQEPLRKIQSFSDLLISQYSIQPDEGVRFLERIQAAASRMSTLIRDLLSFSRISTQQVTPATVSLIEVINRALLDLDLRIQETGAVVRYNLLPTVAGDSFQLELLFKNLFSNSLKFRRTNTVPQIQIRAQIVAADDLPTSVKPTHAATTYHCITVSDNGIGFDEKYVERIFQVFQRLHGRSEFAGTGIGLAICEKVVANHGGAITATSQSGQGSTFSVYLPI